MRFFAGKTSRALALSLAFAAENIKNLPLTLRAREKLWARLVGKSTNNPDSSDKLSMFVMIGKSTSIQSTTRDVGRGSKVQLLFALLLISLRASSERRLNLLSRGGATGVRSSKSDGSPCAMLSCSERMVSIFWTKKVPVWFASSTSSSTGEYN